MPIRIGKIKNINVAFPVVKKLPVLLIGNSSEKKVKIKGTTIILFFRLDSKKYFLIKDKKNTLNSIKLKTTKPKIPVSVRISK